MVRIVRWVDLSHRSPKREDWNDFDIEDTAEKLEVEQGLLEDGGFTDVPELRLLIPGDGWYRWDNVQALPAGDLKIKVIKYTSGDTSHSHEARLQEHESTKPAGLSL